MTSESAPQDTRISSDQDVEGLVERLSTHAEFYRYRPVSNDTVPALEEVTRRECDALFALLDEAAQALSVLQARVGKLERDSFDSLHAIQAAEARLAEAREIARRAWHYMQSPESYSDSERKFVVESLSRLNGEDRTREEEKDA